MKIKSFLILALFFSLLSASGQQKELKVLFVGNSYTFNNNLPHIVSILSEGTNTRLLTRRSVIGGAFLWQHWAGERDLKTKEIIAEGDFDIVVLQDNSMATLMVPDSTIKAIQQFTAFNELHGAKTCLFNTWAREKVPQAQEDIDAIYSKAAEASGSTRIPVGDAWKLSIKLRPSVELYATDGSHPSQLGTVLIASLFVKALTGELPEKFPIAYRVKDEFGETVELLHVDPLDSDFCKRITEEIYRQ